ncbi:MAG: hypothetical protein EOP23_10920 [Hyphomicrobiales bacterium]|nr:MAG: hypothetical protein EOP23_10920 [Hyphomicrobiales bacterium]
MPGEAPICKQKMACRREHAVMIEPKSDGALETARACPDGHAAQKNGADDRLGVDMCLNSNIPVAAQRRRDGLLNGSLSGEF